LRIVEKISTPKEGKQLDGNEHFRVHDMVRATIFAKDPVDMLLIYQRLKEI